MIKILTLLGNNYGGCLQAVALQTILKNYDEVITLNYLDYSERKKNLKDIAKQIIYAKRNKKFKKFKNKYLKTSNLISKIEDDKISKYIVGSDQVWNPNNLSEKARKVFYLNFINDSKRKYSYAASVGADQLDYNDEMRYVKYLTEFNRISLREKSMSEYLNKKYSLLTVNVLDPTLVVNKNFWVDLVKSNNNYINNNNKKNILVYTLGMDNNCNNCIDKFAKDRNEDIVEIFYKKRFKKTKKIKNNCGPLEFLQEIYKSNFIITNSFHGMVFAIIFEKEFYVITRDNMNSRIYDLLDTLKLTNHIIKEKNIDEINKNEYKKIDYNKVKELLLYEKKNSIDFIENICADK